MGVNIYSFNWNFSPERSQGVLEGDVALLQNRMLVVL